MHTIAVSVVVALTPAAALFRDPIGTPGLLG